MDPSYGNSYFLSPSKTSATSPDLPSKVSGRIRMLCTPPYMYGLHWSSVTVQRMLDNLRQSGSLHFETGTRVSNFCCSDNRRSEIEDRLGLHGDLRSIQNTRFNGLGLANGVSEIWAMNDIHRGRRSDKQTANSELWRPEAAPENFRKDVRKSANILNMPALAFSGTNVNGYDSFHKAEERLSSSNIYVEKYSTATSERTFVEKEENMRHWNATDSSMESAGGLLLFVSAFSAPRWGTNNHFFLFACLLF